MQSGDRDVYNGSHVVRVCGGIISVTGGPKNSAFVTVHFAVGGVRVKKLMWKSWFLMQSLKRREEGQGMVEYGLIIALIALAVIAALSLLAGHINGIFNSVGTKLNATA